MTTAYKVVAHLGRRDTLAAKMSWYCKLYDGKDWWNRAVPNGSTPKGLMDYYLDTAYPIEHTGHGAGQVRVATCGDGATNARGDLFLVNPAGDGLDCTPALAAAYQASGDPLQPVAQHADRR